MEKKIIVVFGSSQIKEENPEYPRIRELGKALAEAGFRVCSGGYAGAMEAVSRGAKDAGGETIGVTIRDSRKSHNPWIEKDEPMPDWKERLFRLIELGDGYVVCRGGTGTLVELSCVWEMMRKKMMPLKPVVVLDSLWEELISLLLASPEMEGGFFPFRFANSPEQAAAILKQEIRCGCQ
ncbi:MAG TPA: LOG family protein [Candidatus Omnitrophota bacterium]|nr:LOG family protein [Candidatus Omnitrophota bacterium]